MAQGLLNIKMVINILEIIEKEKFLIIFQKKKHK